MGKFLLGEFIDLSLKRRLTKNVESSEADKIKENNLEEKQLNEKQTIIS